MRILLVEDDDDISDLVRRVLMSQHYSVDVAYDGEAGYELAMTSDYDLLILDVMIPKMDGRTLCKQLRLEGLTTSILMLTALGTSSDVILGLDQGADDYLTKPFDVDVLLAHVRSLTRRSSDQRTAEIRIADLVVDTARRSVQRAGKTLQLTGKEFSLLELMVMNEGKVLTREAIIEHVWDMNFDARSNVIESLMSCLRHSIDRDFDTPLIHTIRGVGYRFGVCDA